MNECMLDPKPSINWSGGQCCCNCQHQVMEMKSPATHVGWACVAFMFCEGEPWVYTGFPEHGMCELWCLAMGVTPDVPGRRYRPDKDTALHGPGGLVELDLSVRTFEALRRARYSTVRDVQVTLEQGERAFVDPKVRNTGPKSIAEIRQRVQEWEEKQARSAGQE